MECGFLSFEAIIEDYHLQAPGLNRLALIIRAADIKGQEKLLPKGSACVPSRRASRRWAYRIKNDWCGNFRSTTHSTSTRGKRYEYGLDDFHQAIEPGETVLRRLECAYSCFYLRPLP